MNHFEKGDTYKPPEGPCKKHTVEVVNPNVMLWKRLSAQQEHPSGHTVDVHLEGFVACVFVRCQKDQNSWSFPVAIGKPDPGEREDVDRHLSVLWELLREAQDAVD